MKWLTLDKIKDHCRIERSFTDEDDLLTDYGEAAEETVLELCNRTEADILAQYGGIPKNIVLASLMLVDASYQFRCPASVQNISIAPYAFDRCIKPYMKLV